MRELHLFAGIGGGILGGLLLGHTCVCAVEIEQYCRDVLLQRQRDGMLPQFPIWDDVRTFDGKPWRGKVDIVCGGFPCQDISAAGKGAGIDGDRSGLWMEMARIIGEIQPRYCFVENSPVLTSRGLGRVLGDLATLGYDARWGVLGASDAAFLVGNPAVYHDRFRIWIVGKFNGQGSHADEISLRGHKWRKSSLRLKKLCEGFDSHKACSQRIETEHAHANGSNWWDIEPDVGRVASRVPARVDRISGLGNAQVPIVAALAWLTLTDN